MRFEIVMLHIETLRWGWCCEQYSTLVVCVVPFVEKIAFASTLKPLHLINNVMMTGIMVRWREMPDVIRDTITLQSVDNDGKHYDQLSRAHFAGTKVGRMSASVYVIDINTSVYPMQLFSKYKLLLSTSEVDSKDYDYVTSGHVYKIVDDKHPAEFFVSFGGLLMHGSAHAFLSPINLDDHLYLMLQKIQ